MTYLELINDVLVRLRETTVASVGETTYSTLIGKFVNDAKRQVEDAYAWNVLGTTITLSTTSGTYQYALTGAGQKFQVIDVLNVTSNVGMKNIDFASMNRKQNFSTPVSGIPSEYCFDGIDGSYDTKVTIYPRPDGVYSIPFSLAVPQATLTNGATVIAVPDVLVAQNAYARALVERGEDGGLSSSEAYQLYKSMLSDYIALEGTRYPENQEFVAV
jgi:hypothetical protein